MTLMSAPPQIPNLSSKHIHNPSVSTSETNNVSLIPPPPPPPPLEPLNPTQNHLGKPIFPLNIENNFLNNSFVQNNGFSSNSVVNSGFNVPLFDKKLEPLNTSFPVYDNNNNNMFITPNNTKPDFSLPNIPQFPPPPDLSLLSDHKLCDIIKSDRKRIKPDPGNRILAPGKRRARKMFTESEVSNLVRGVSMFGEGKWARILDYYNFNDRTSVDLKDKWRNLQKPSSTVKPPKGRRTRLRYTESECEQLRRGVNIFGHNWVAILKEFHFNSERTPVDLKDKWRNLQMREGLVEAPPREARRFLLLDADNSIFRNVYPRDAALKAATRGYEYIKLLEIGTQKIHVFAGERKQVSAPSIRKFSRTNGFVWKGRVSKLGMDRASLGDLVKSKINVTMQFGSREAHEIAPNISVDDLMPNCTSINSTENSNLQHISLHNNIIPTINNTETSTQAFKQENNQWDANFSFGNIKNEGNLKNFAQQNTKISESIPPPPSSTESLKHDSIIHQNINNSSSSSLNNNNKQNTNKQIKTQNSQNTQNTEQTTKNEPKNPLKSNTVLSKVIERTQLINTEQKSPQISSLSNTTNNSLNTFPISPFQSNCEPLSSFTDSFTPFPVSCHSDFAPMDTSLFSSIFNENNNGQNNKISHFSDSFNSQLFDYNKFSLNSELNSSSLLLEN